MSDGETVPHGVPERAARVAVHLFWGVARVFSVVVLLAAWEILARSGTFTPFQLPAMPAMLFEKKVDLIPAVLPFSLNPKLKDEGKVLFEQRDALGVTQMIVWTARKSFIDKNRAAMIDFMEDMLRITKWYQDPKNHAEAAQIASKVTKVPAERFGWLFTNQDTYRDANLMPNLEALQRNVDTTRDLGFVKKPIDIKKYVDLSLVQEAAKRLK